MGRNTLGCVEMKTDELKVGDVIHIHNVPSPFDKMWLKVTSKDGKTYGLEFFKYV